MHNAPLDCRYAIWWAMPTRDAYNPSLTSLIPIYRKLKALIKVCQGKNWTIPAVFILSKKLFLAVKIGRAGRFGAIFADKTAHPITRQAVGRIRLAD